MRRNKKSALTSAAAASAAGLLLGSGHAQAAPYLSYWNTPSSADYLTAANWTDADSGATPALPTDVALIANGATVLIGAGDSISGANAPDELWTGGTYSTGTVSQPSGAGYVQQTGGLMTVGDWFVVGRSGNAGSYNISGNSVLTGLNSTLELNGNYAAGGLTSATMYISGNANVSSGATMQIGTGGGTLFMSGGTLHGGNEFWIGQGGGQGQVVQTGGVVTNNSWFSVGRQGGTGVYNISGGSLTTNQTGGQAFILGDGSGGTGTMIVSGTASVSDSGAEMWIGSGGGVGTLILDGGSVTTHNWVSICRNGASTGTLTINGGTFTHLGGGGAFVVGADGNNNTATLNLNGGTLNTDSIQVFDNSGLSSVINLNGGTLVSNAGDSGFIGGHGTFTAVQIRGSSLVPNSGAVLNANGDFGELGITQSITHSNINGDPAIDGGVTVLGGGNVSLSAGNSYTGNVLVQNSELQVTQDLGFGIGNSSAGSADANGVAPMTITLSNGELHNNGNSFTIDANRTIQLKGTGFITPGWSGYAVSSPIVDYPGIPGNNLAVPFDSGVLTLNATNTYTGATTIGSMGVNPNAQGAYYWSAGGANVTLQLNNPNALPQGTQLNFGVMTENTTVAAILDLNGNSPAVGGISSVNANGNGLTGTNGYIINENTGTTSTLTIGDNINNSAGITSNSTLIYAGSIVGGLYTLPNGGGGTKNVSTGTINLVKVGPGTQVLTGSSSYTGTTQVNAGKLYINGANTNSVFTVTNATLGGSGVISQSATLDSTSTIEAGYLGSGALNVSGGLTVAGGTMLRIGNLTSFPNSGTLAGITTSAFNISSPGSINVTVTSATGGLTVGSVYDLVQYTSTNLTNSNLPTGTVNLPGRGTGTVAFNSSNDMLQLTVGQTNYVVWTGQTNGTWDTATTNWKLGVASVLTPTQYIDSPGDTVVFDNTAAGSAGGGNVSLATTLHPNSVTFNNSSLAYTVSGAGGIGGLGTLTKYNTGVVTLKTANTYTGATNVYGGTLALGSGGSVVSATTTVLGGNLVVGSGASISSTSYSVAGGTFQIGNGATVAPAAVTLGSGATSGTLQLGDSNGPANFTPTSLTFANNTSSVIGGNAVASTLTLNDSPTLTVAALFGSGTAGATPANSLALNIIGGGTLALTASNTYTGGTNVSGGTVLVNNNNSLGAGNIAFTSNTTLRPTVNNLVLPAADSFTLGTTSDTFDTNGFTVTLNGAITNTQISGRPILAAGTGTLVLAGTLNVMGSNSNNSDNPAIFMQNTGTTTSITGSGNISGISMAWYNSTNSLILNPTGTLNFTNTDTALDVGQQGGNGAVTQNGGTVTMAGNLYLGQWDGSYGSYTMNAGTLRVTNFYEAGASNGDGNAVYIQNGGSVTVNNWTTLNQNGAGHSNWVLNGGNYNNTGNSFTLASAAGTTDVTINAGNLSTGQIVLSGGNNSVQSVLTLNGGVLSTAGISGRNSGPLSVVNFNGGTLQAAADSGAFLSGVTQANIYSGAAIIDTNGHSVTISQNLTPVSGSGVTNVQVTSGGNGQYVGAPAVYISGGGGTGATAVATITNNNVSGITITNPGIGYTSAPTVNLYAGGGSGASIGTVTLTPNGSDGGLIKKGAGSLTLSGSNTYLGGTQVQGGTVVVANSAALGTGPATLSNGSVLRLTSTAANPINMGSTGQGWTSIAGPNTAGYKPVYSANGLSVQMTDTQSSVASLAADPNLVTISNQTGFTASFTYTHTGVSAPMTVADGITFALTTNTVNQAATNPGQPGGDLGFADAGGNLGTGVFGLGIEEYQDEAMTGFYNGSSTAFYNPAGVTTKLIGPTGQVVSSTNPTNPLNATASQVTIPTISSSASLQVTINYAYNAATGGQVTESLTSLTTGQTYTYVTTGVDLAQILSAGDSSTTNNAVNTSDPYGTGVAFITFTGSTGGANDNISISNFQFANSSSGVPFTPVNITNPVQVAAGLTGSVLLAPIANYSYGSVGPITIQSGGLLNISIGSFAQPGVTKGILVTPSVTLANKSSGQLDIMNNGLDITNQNASNPASSLHDVNAMVGTAYHNGTWTGPGITSTTAATDTTHLTAVGVIQNSQLSTPYSATNLFMGTAPGANDVLVKLTYYGDANLDGSVNSVDYSLIDAGFLSHGTLTGWANGDFNYDGVINGSDYTLIDNAYNTQGASLAAEVSSQIASPTAQIAGGVASAVPEPASLGLLAMGGMALLGRRRRR